MFGRRRRDEGAPASPPADGTLRFVLFRPVGPSFTIDAIVDSDRSGRLGDVGSAITLRLHRPVVLRDDLEIERVLRRWADEDRVVDVTLSAAEGSKTVTALEVDGARMRLQLLG
jgi:hypothetical protein